MHMFMNQTATPLHIELSLPRQDFSKTQQINFAVSCFGFLVTKIPWQ
jgi:hypothetical protein